jgi:AraC family ethanolamine operon transcriptional activator
MKHFFLKTSFDDLDQFSHAVHAWDLDFRQLDRGEFKAELLQLIIDNSLVSYARLNRCFDQRGSIPPGKWTFAIFSEQSSSIIWHEQEVSNNTIVVYKPGSEIDCVSLPDFEVYTLSFQESFLNEIGTKLGLPEIKKLVNNADSFECSLRGLAVIRGKLHQVVNAVNSGTSQIDTNSLMQSLDVELAEQILLILSRSYPNKNTSTGLRKRAIQRTKVYLTEFPFETHTVSQLCSIAGVSERTLQYAFLEHYGVSPKTYLKNIRLNGVRRELWKSNQHVSRVNEVAGSWGFWHMGQFAADYQKLFGELPSDTLKRGNYLSR